jgi:hypothetical protein
MPLDAGETDAGAAIDAGPSAPAPRVAFAEPADGAVEVPANTSLRVFFTTPIDPATLTAESFTLVDDRGTAVTGTIAAWAGAAVLTPSAPLEIDRTYTATITTAVLGVDGQALEAETSWSFSTRRREWGAATLVGRREENALRVEMDAIGNTIAVWRAFDDGSLTPACMYASRFTPESGWSLPDRIESECGADGYYLDLAVSPSGHAAAVWAVPDSTGRNRICASRYTAGGYWSEATIINPGSVADSFGAEVAIDSVGNVFVAWAESDGVIWATQFRIGFVAPPNPSFPLEWRSPTQVSAEGIAGDPHLGVDRRGRAVLVWRTYDSSTDVGELWASSFDGTTWEASRRMEGDSPQPRYPVDVAVDASGAAVTVWARDDGVWVNRFVPAMGWEAASRIGTSSPTSDLGGTASVDPVVVAASANGDSIAAWRLTPSPTDVTDSHHHEIWASRYTATGGWQEALLIDADSLSRIPGGGTPDVDGQVLDVAMSDAGDAVVAWPHRGLDVSRVIAAEFHVPTGWGAGTEIRRVNAVSLAGAMLDLAMDPSGNAVIAWSEATVQWDRDVWIAMYR